MIMYLINYPSTQNCFLPFLFIKQVLNTSRSCLDIGLSFQVSSLCWSLARDLCKMNVGYSDASRWHFRKEFPSFMNLPNSAMLKFQPLTSRNSPVLYRLARHSW